MADQNLNTPEEVWKAIPGFLGYEASSHGRIRSYWKNNGIHPSSLSNKPRKILKPYPDKQNYSKYNLFINGKVHCKKGHQLVLLTFIGPCPMGMQACHNNGNPAENFLENLRYDTCKNNHGDKIKHGTNGNGEKNNMVKLTENHVIKIREMALQGYTYSEIGKLFNISFGNIGNIIRRDSWKHI